MGEDVIEQRQQCEESSNGHAGAHVSPSAAGLSSLEGLSELTDPVRRELYDFAAAAGEPVRRDDAAQAAGISRALAAYHLDRLAAAGLLAVSYKRPEGRTGPGAGRPAKHYECSGQELSVSVPPRNYPLLARILTDVVASSPDVKAALMGAAAAEGEVIGRGSPGLLEGLTADGYAPQVGEHGEIRLLNCPFHALAQRQTELVCGLNLELLRGVLTGRGEDPARVELRPSEGECCVVIHPRPLPSPEAPPRSPGPTEQSPTREGSPSVLQWAAESARMAERNRAAEAARAAEVAASGGGGCCGGQCGG